MLKFFDADPGWRKIGSGMEKCGSGMEKVGSGIKHPGSATLLFLSHAPINKPPGSRRVTKFTPAQKVTGQ